MQCAGAPPAVHVASPVAFSVLLTTRVRPRCDAPWSLCIWKTAGNLLPFPAVTHITEIAEDPLMTRGGVKIITLHPSAFYCRWFENELQHLSILVSSELNS